MSYLPTTLHGETLFRQQADRIVAPVREIHKVTQKWQAPRSNSFLPETAPDGFPNMRIVLVDPTEEIPGIAYTLDVEAEGISDDRVFLELDAPESNPDTGFDELRLQIFTREPDDARWAQGARRITGTDLTSVTGAAADDLLTKSAHGLSTGRVVVPTFASGFAGITSGSSYFACVISSSTLKLALSAANAAAGSVSNNGTPFAITGTAASTNKILATAHGLSNGTVVTFPELTGGAGLTAILVPYYVVNTATNDFQVALTAGGSVVTLATNISAGTCRTGSTIDITTDGTGMTLTPTVSGYEQMWLVDRQPTPHRALDYWTLALTYKGLRKAKKRKRTISISPQTVSDDAFPAQITNVPIWFDFPPAWVSTTTFGPASGTQAVEIDLPNIVVTDDFVSTFPPPTTLVPGCWIPADAPAVNDLAAALSTIAAARTYHFPGGTWKCTAMNVEQILDQACYHYVLSWTYQPAQTPRSAAA